MTTMPRVAQNLASFLSGTIHRAVSTKAFQPAVSAAVDPAGERTAGR